MNRISKLYYKILSLAICPHIFIRFGKRSVITKPLQLDGTRNIQVGNHVFIHSLCWLAAVPLTGEKAELIIGDNCTLGHFNHIYATHRIVLEDHILTADKVYISDNLHDYSNPDMPIINQSIRQTNDVIIGEGSWLGENVCIIGASVGKHCVIGANAVVTHDIPDYCVAVGAPARVVKKYNFNTQQWEKV